jgi:hypothetical protein
MFFHSNYIMFNFNITISDLAKYLIEGIAVALVAFYIPQKQTKLNSIAMIALSAAISFFVLDKFAPLVYQGAQQGSGFGIGMNMVGGDTSDEKFDCCKTESDAGNVCLRSNGSGGYPYFKCRKRPEGMRCCKGHGNRPECKVPVTTDKRYCERN